MFFDLVLVPSFCSNHVKHHLGIAVVDFFLLFSTSPSLIPKGTFAWKFYRGFSYWVILMEEIMHKYYTKEVYRLFFYI